MYVYFNTPRADPGLLARGIRCINLEVRLADFTIFFLNIQRHILDEIKKYVSSFESNAGFPYGKKCTAANNFREQLANTLGILCEYSGNTLRLLGNHNLIWLTSIRGMFARCSLFTCKLGLPRTLPRIFREHAFKAVD